MRDELVQIAAAVGDEADLDPVLAQNRERRQRILVEREALVLLPGAHELLGARACPCGVAAHAADDLLGELDPELVVVDVVGMALERVERRQAGRLVEVRLERAAVPFPHLAVALRAKLRPGPCEREVDVKYHCFDHLAEDSLGGCAPRPRFSARPARSRSSAPRPSRPGPAM